MLRRRDGRGRFDERDLRELDRDLRRIVIEERCSYGSELRAELVGEHARLEGGRPSRAWPVSAVGIAAVLMLALAGSLAVPQARGAVLALFRSPAVVDTSRPGTARPEGGEVAQPAPAPSPPMNEEPIAVTRRVPAEPAGESLPPPLRPGTVPELADLDEARQIVAREYPAVLQQRGIGGRVQLLMWVGPDGMTEFPQIENTSGLRELDLAALRATRALRFVPATLLGEEVGTWVSFSIRFQPLGGTELAQPDPEYAAFHVPLSN